MVGVGSLPAWLLFLSLGKALFIRSFALCFSALS